MIFYFLTMSSFKLLEFNYSISDLMFVLEPHSTLSFLCLLYIFCADLSFILLATTMCLDSSAARLLLCFLFKKINFSKKKSGIPTECRAVLVQIRSDFLPDLIWVQTGCQGYQQTLEGKNIRAKVKN